MGIRIYGRGFKQLHHLRLGGGQINNGNPQPPAEIIIPEWITSGDLGAFEYDEEINIQLEYYDPSNIVSGFQLVGTLPTGIFFNNVGATIYGYNESTSSGTFNFQIVMTTVYNDTIVGNFSISVVYTTSEIEWGTDSDLGEYGVGSSINQTIEAFVVESEV